MNWENLYLIQSEDLFFFRDHLDFGHELGENLWLILTESLLFRETSQNFGGTCKHATVSKGYQSTKSLGNPGLRVRVRVMVFVVKEKSPVSD